MTIKVIKNLKEILKIKLFVASFDKLMVQGLVTRHVEDSFVSLALLEKL